MEVKVWVEGIQRVVSGVTMTTTCQDVVIALAHALGRTGRFTLIERWRDNDRPLTPAECPLQVLHSWGEYAGEVRFVLCQAGSELQRRTSREKVGKKVAEKTVTTHKVVSPQTQSAVSGEASVKRSLTFSGAHNQALEDGSWSLSASGPTNKFRKTQQGPVPNRDNRLVTDSQNSTHSRQEFLDAQMRQTNQDIQPRKNAEEREHARARPSFQRSQSLVSSDHPTDPSSYLPPLIHAIGNSGRPSAFQPPRSLRSCPVSPMRSAPGEGFSHPNSNVSSRIQPQPGPLSRQNSQPSAQSYAPSSSKPSVQTSTEPSTQTPTQLSTEPPSNQLSAQSYAPSKPGHSSSQSQPDPASLSHTTVTKPQPVSALSSRSVKPSPAPGPAHKAAVTSNTITASGPSDVQIEEYDLDCNFPHSSSKHSDLSPNTLEYRLVDGLLSGSGPRSGPGSSSGPGSKSGVEVEGEHAKLLRLVGLQQQRLKSQESQISLVNTEISNLEDKGLEYEKNLRVVMEELLLQESRQLQLEPQITDLEKVDWETVLEDEKKQEIDLTLQIASCKAKVLEQEDKLHEVEIKEEQLLAEIHQEEENLSREKQRLETEKQEDFVNQDQETETKAEISKLRIQVSEMESQSAECESSLARVESELSGVEKILGEKGEELRGLEEDLKKENLKDFGTNSLAELDLKSSNSHQVLRRILEDSLSPRLTVQCHGEGADNSTSALSSLLGTFSPPTHSGVWV